MKNEAFNKRNKVYINLDTNKVIFKNEEKENKKRLIVENNNIYKKVLKAKAYAKVNLDLRVGPKRKDGYHEISSIVVPISLHDDIVLKNSNDEKNHILVTKNCKNPNVILEYVEKLQKKYKLKQKLDIKIEKRIPLGAGLAGLSTDIAQILLLMNDFYELDLTPEELKEEALSFGIDTFYCLNMKPAILQNKGDHITYLEQSPVDKIGLFFFENEFSTKKVYEEYEYDYSENWKASFENQVKLLNEKKYFEFWQNCKNDLEETAANQDFEYLSMYKNLKNRNIKIQMSGSGATLFTLDMNFYDEWANSPLLENFNYYKVLGFKKAKKQKTTIKEKIAKIFKFILTAEYK